MDFKNFIEYNLCRFPNWYSLLRTATGAKDWEKKAFLETIERNWNIIEIGANQGYFTSLFQKLVGKKGVVHAFEPIPATFELLKESVSNDPNNYFLYNLGTGAENLDSVEFHLPVKDHGQATMSPHASDAWQNQEIHKIICKVVRLDDFEPIKNLEKVDFIKLDAEGASCHRWGAQFSRKTQTYSLFRRLQRMDEFISNTPRDFDQFLETINYQQLLVVGEKLVPINSLESFFKNKNPAESFNFVAK